MTKRGRSEESLCEGNAVERTPRSYRGEMEVLLHCLLTSLLDGCD